MSDGEKNEREGRGHHKLEAWKRAGELVLGIYTLTQNFPKEEMFGLTSQIRRAAVSIPSDIAEGAARAGENKFAQFLNISRGSLSELETQLLISADLAYIENNNTIFDTVDRVFG